MPAWCMFTQLVVAVPSNLIMTLQPNLLCVMSRGTKFPDAVDSSKSVTRFLYFDENLIRRASSLPEANFEVVFVSRADKQDSTTNGLCLSGILETIKVHAFERYNVADIVKWPCLSNQHKEEIMELVMASDFLGLMTLYNKSNPFLTHIMMARTMMWKQRERELGRSVDLSLLISAARVLLYILSLGDDKTGDDSSFSEASKRLFNGMPDSLLNRYNMRSNKVHLCGKWHSAEKTWRAQERVKQINPGYGWKIQVVRDPTAFPPPIPLNHEKTEYTDLLNTLAWMGEYTTQHKLPSRYKGDNHFKQDWVLGIYKQLMTHQFPKWAEEEPACAANFASMEWPRYARGYKDMEQATGSIHLAQLWKNDSGTARLTVKLHETAKATSILGLEWTPSGRQAPKDRWNNLASTIIIIDVLGPDQMEVVVKVRRKKKDTAKPQPLEH
eukprot:jgi/Psemu1/18983/gm1.18983_g